MPAGFESNWPTTFELQIGYKVKAGSVRLLHVLTYTAHPNTHPRNGAKIMEPGRHEDAALDTVRSKALTIDLRGRAKTKT
jgi:hypothetical protein